MSDVLLVGGGLASGLIALRLAQRRPQLDVTLIEQDDRLGGEHTWSFHASDLGSAQREWIEALVVQSWPAYDVEFPGFRRRIPGGYSSLTSARLREAVTAQPRVTIRLGARAASLTASDVVLESGERLAAACVVDGRGSETPGSDVAYQKFLGQDLELAEPHRLEVPLLMDARVPQLDGFRFFYLLPWSERTLLVEDTRYSDTPDLDREALRRAIADYAVARGFRVSAVLREEVGVLPIPLAADRDWRDRPAGAARVGVRAGLFHATTGYSLPQAVGLADAIAELPQLTTAAIERVARERSRRASRDGRFFRFLNRMLFRAAAPGERRRVFEHFYGLPDGLIHRFYAGRLRFGDRLRILAGRPPVPILAAARCLRERPHG